MKMRIRHIAAIAAAIAAFASTEAAANVTYTYDTLGRLATAAYDSGVTVYYRYDENGNRLVSAVTTNSGTGVWGSFNWGAANW